MSCCLENQHVKLGVMHANVSGPPCQWNDLQVIPATRKADAGCCLAGSAGYLSMPLGASEDLWRAGTRTGELRW